MSEAPIQPPAPPAQPDEHLIGLIEKPKGADASSPVPEPVREPNPETLAMVMDAIVPTFEQMMRKPVATDSIEFELPQEDGSTIVCTAKLEAIDGPAYDKLQSDCPPNAVQRARGAAFNQDKFGPALLARVVRQPSFSEEQWAQLWNNPRWSGGELSSLFWSANGLCLKGLNVPLRSSG